MAVTTLLIDLDDTVYPPSSGIWGLIGDRIDLFIHDRIKLSWEKIPNLRRQYFIDYGTTMRGLVVNYGIDPEDYLKFVHDVPIENLLSPDLELGEILAKFTQSKVIFTNSDERHARRVLNALQLESLFDNIIDIQKVSPYCKPQPDAYQAALNQLGGTSSQECLVIDDSLRNLQTARSLGFHTLLVGPNPDHAQVDYAIPTLKELTITHLGGV